MLNHGDFFSQKPPRTQEVMCLSHERDMKIKGGTASDPLLSCDLFQVLHPPRQTSLISLYHWIALKSLHFASRN